MGRYDAMRDLGIRFKWKGVGVSPQPGVKPWAVEIDGRLVRLYWPAKGWGTTRLFMVCPLCGGHSRFIYELPGEGLGCHEHVSAARVRKEAALSKLRRARVMQRNAKHRARGLRLEADAMRTLCGFFDFDGLLEWARREPLRGRSNSAR